WKSPHIFHTFKKGHRLMIQVQSSFFPLIDRNPQVFLDIYNAKDSDFKAQTHTIYRSAQYPSSITIGRILPK
ncbi:MAG TPA: CocE/NonD family hydrolase C-terminal non-catalytic domain-containing protein, partial [Rhodothermales bacterium]|nr:CocE/NonD family hydrolase C-terminal non-catalytic domain-containing protein [Rhodothermales bacterium]